MHFFQLEGDSVTKYQEKVTIRAGRRCVTTTPKVAQALPKNEIVKVRIHASLLPWALLAQGTQVFW